MSLRLARTARVAACALTSAWSGFAHAQQATAAPTPVTGQLLSVVLGMALVLTVIAGAAWLLKRLAPRTYGSSSVLRVIAGAAVGQRERVVVVEVGSTWLVLGVAPGSVNALHQMPRVEKDESTPAPMSAQPPFAQWLKKFMDGRGQGAGGEK